MSAFRLPNPGNAWLLCLGHAATHWVSAIFYLMLPFIRAELGLSYAEAGLLASVYQGGFFIGSVVSGPMVDITGRRVIYQTGALVSIGAAITVLGTVEHFHLYALLALIMGAAANFWHPPAIAFIAEAYPDNRGLALGVHGMGSNVGEAYGPLIAGYLIAGLSWQTTAVGVGVPTILIGFFLFVVLIGKEHRAAGDAGSGQTLGAYFAGLLGLLRNPVVVGLSLMAGIRSAGQSMLRTFLPLFMKDVLGMGAAMMGWALFIMQHGGMVAAPVAGVAADRYGRRKMLVVVLFATSLAMIGLTLIEDKVLFVLGMAVLGFVTYAMRPISQSWMMDAVPRGMAASSMSLMFLVQGVLGMVSPFLGGWMADTYGIASVFYVIAGMLLLANAVTFFIPEAPRNAAQAAE